MNRFKNLSAYQCSRNTFINQILFLPFNQYKSHKKIPLVYFQVLTILNPHLHFNFKDFQESIHNHRISTWILISSHRVRTNLYQMILLLNCYQINQLLSLLCNQRILKVDFHLTLLRYLKNQLLLKTYSLLLTFKLLLLSIMILSLNFSPLQHHLLN